MKNFFLDLRTLKENLASAVILVSPIPCAGSSPRSKIYFFLLLACVDELLSTPKLVTFLQK